MKVNYVLEMSNFLVCDSKNQPVRFKIFVEMSI